MHLTFSVTNRKTGIYVAKEVPRDRDGLENEEAFFNDSTFQIGNLFEVLNLNW